MLMMSDVRDWLRTLSPQADHYHVGRLDAKKERSIGVYQLPPGEPRAYNQKTFVKNVSVLMHWTKNYSETEEASLALYDAIKNAENVVINGHSVKYIQLAQSEPIDVDKADDHIYERVIEFKIFFEED